MNQLMYHYSIWCINISFEHSDDKALIVGFCEIDVRTLN